MATITYTEAQFTTSSGAVNADQLQREFIAAAPVGVGFPSTGFAFTSLQVFEPGASPRATLETAGVLDAPDIATALAVVNGHDALGHGEGFQGGALEGFGGSGVLQNLFFDSENFDESGAWADPAGETTTVTNNAIGPTGLLDADTVTWDDGVGLGKRQSSLGCVSGNPYTFYGFTRFAGGTGNATLNFDLKDGTGAQITATAEWKRFRVELTAGVGSDFFDVTHFGGTAGDAFEFWGFQLVDGHDTHEHPYLPTTSDVRHTAVDIVGSSLAQAASVGRTIYVDEHQAVPNPTGAPGARVKPRC